MTHRPDRFTTDPNPAIAGKDLEICFTNKDLAGTPIRVAIDNGEGQRDRMEIPLDENGHGSVNWPVLTTGWDVVKLNHATSLEHSIFVVYSYQDFER